MGAKKIEKEGWKIFLTNKQNLVSNMNARMSKTWTSVHQRQQESKVTNKGKKMNWTLQGFNHSNQSPIKIDKRFINCQHSTNLHPSHALNLCLIFFSFPFRSPLPYSHLGKVWATNYTLKGFAIILKKMRNIRLKKNILLLLLLFTKLHWKFIYIYINY